MLPNVRHVRPATLGEAVRLAAAPGAVVHAGGTDLLGCLRDGVLGAGTLVSLAGLAELRGIREEGGKLRLGALATVAEVAAQGVVRRLLPGLAQAAAAVGSPQLRHQGTVGGNLCQKPRCWYYRGPFHCLRKGGDTCYAVAGDNRYHAIFGGDSCFYVHPSDLAPMLVALGALARLAGPAGGRVVPLEKFYVLPEEDFTRETVLQPGELLTEVVVPLPPAGTRTAYRKVGPRAAWDFALAGVAVALAGEGGKVRTAQVVLAGVAPVPWRATAAEKLLADQPLTPAVAARAGEAAAVGAAPLAGNAYKVELVRQLVREALLALA